MCIYIYIHLYIGKETATIQGWLCKSKALWPARLPEDARIIRLVFLQSCQVVGRLHVHSQHIYICRFFVHICTYLHIYIYIYSMYDIYIYIYMHIYMYIYMYICIVYIYMYIHTLANYSQTLIKTDLFSKRLVFFHNRKRAPAAACSAIHMGWGYQSISKYYEHRLSLISISYWH